MYIETISFNNSSEQLPVLITLAYHDVNSDLISKYCLININEVNNLGYEYAANKLWNTFFTYLKENINYKSVTFTPNLGAFYDYFIYLHIFIKWFMWSF